ncbi:MAG: diacylglycerol kinase family lipid kinase [Sporolactobacillus sp.]
MKKARLIYNPSSGRETAGRNIAYILDRLEDAGYEASARATKGKGDAFKAARKAVRRQFDLVIAAGGDGTVNEVVSGLAEQDGRPRLGVLPLGTTNDFARSVGIPRDITKACDILCGGAEMAIDVGKVTFSVPQRLGHRVPLVPVGGKVDHRYFINIAGGGRLTELTYDVPSKLKTMLGQLAYYIKGIEMLPSIRPVEVTIHYDDHVFSGNMMMFLISNTNSVGGFEKLAPDASLSDGRFDLIILKEANLPEFARLVSLATRGEHLKDSKIIYAQASRISVHVDEELQLNIDGEYGGCLPGEVTNLPRHLQLLVPTDVLETRFLAGGTDTSASGAHESGSPTNGCE